MKYLFRTFVARTTQVLVDQLMNTDVSSVEFLNEKEFDLNGPLFDISCAEVVHSSTMFPDVKSDVIMEWLIFLYDTTDPQRNIDIYELCEQLPSGLSAREFVSRSHVRLLSRAVDPEGEAVFVQLMERGQMSRHDVLCLFAQSAEARTLGLKVIVIPSPSPWSACVNFETSERPKLLVRSVN